MPDVDVVVVGGGPAGSSTASVLAANGLKVVLLDKSAFPRDKCCGGGLTASALRLAESLDFDPRAIESFTPISQVTIRTPTKNIVPFELPQGQGIFAAVVKRDDFDTALLHSADSNGANIQEKTGLKNLQLSQDNRTVSVETSNGDQFQASYVIGADGARSLTRQLTTASYERVTSLSVNNSINHWHACRQYFEGVGELASSAMWIWLDEDLLPGYAWSFPLSGHRANVGLGVLPARIRASTSSAMGPILKRTFYSLFKRRHIQEVLGEKAKPSGRMLSWPIPISTSPTSHYAWGGRVLFVGDAARTADPFSGEGIGQAMRSGILAAMAVTRAGSAAPLLAAHYYKRSMQIYFGMDHRLERTLSHIMARPSLAKPAVSIVTYGRWTRRNFAKWLMEAYPRAQLFEPAFWHRGAMSLPGAYAGYPYTVPYLGRKGSTYA
ncbi:MAG: NAD(P)/FAD-dependent oxidoreductase [Actinobacteria bacterium]|nr:NAD(P)/FAD-dependent oxidoreductase [Actinomycetota bacterium]